MKAIVYTTYGSPDVLQLREVNKPAPKDDEVLIRVHAATVTAGDVNVRGFTHVPPGFGPLPRLMFGLRHPKRPILGTEIAGVVEAVGSRVSLFKPGDSVFGIGSSEFGAYAEYACRRERGALVLKPCNLSFEEAAAIPFGAGTALYFLRDKAKLQRGQRIAVLGAGGGVGVFAVQIAKHLGAEVTGVCSSEKADLVRSLGVDTVIDYTKEELTSRRDSFDCIMDTVVRKHSFAQYRHLLTPRGSYLAVAGGTRELRQALMTSLAGGRRVHFGSPDETKQRMEDIRGLAESQVIRPVIGRRYPLEQTAEAHRYVDQGHKTGSVVISIG